MRRALLALAVGSMAGCNAPSGDPPAAVGAAEAPRAGADEVSAVETPPPVEPAPVPPEGQMNAAADKAGASARPAPPPTPTAYPLNPLRLPEGEIALEDRDVVWTRVADLPGPITFKALWRGALALGDERAYAMDDTGAFAETTRTVPREEVRGYYPKDAWFVWLDPRDSSMLTFSLKRWRNHGRWVPQDLVGTRTHEDIEQVFMAKGGPGGYLLADREEGRVQAFRIAPAGAIDPDEQPIVEGDVQQIFETKKGRLYVTVEIERDGRKYTVVQRSCTGRDCLRRDAATLPSPEGFASTWWLRPVAYSRHDVSASATESRVSLETGDSEGVPWLVHIERGKWRFERLPDGRGARFLWPLVDKGLWAEVHHRDGSELWHRDPKKRWTRVRLPDGIDVSKPLQVALPDRERVWLAGEIDGAHGVWETRAAAQAASPSDSAEPKPSSLDSSTAEPAAPDPT